MPINVPAHWYRDMGFNQHPFAPIAWKIHDINLQDSIDEDVEETLQEVVDTLVHVEKEEYMKDVLLRIKRRERVLEGKPVKKKSEELLKEAFAHAMIDKQETFDTMTYEQFCTIYEDVQKFINEHKNPGKMT